MTVHELGAKAYRVVDIRDRKGCPQSEPVKTMIWNKVRKDSTADDAP